MHTITSAVAQHALLVHFTHWEVLSGFEFNFDLGLALLGSNAHKGSAISLGVHS